MERENESWASADAAEWKAPANTERAESLPKDALRERHNSVDAKISRTVAAYIDYYKGGGYSVVEALMDIKSELSKVTGRLIESDDDNERDFLAVQRAVLLRAQQVYEGDEGVRRMVSSVEDADDVVELDEPTLEPEVANSSLLPHADQMARESRFVDDVLVIKEPDELERHDLARSSPIPRRNAYQGDTNPGANLRDDRLAS